MKIIRFIKNILKDFLYGAFGHLVIVLGIFLTALISTLALSLIPIVIALITKNGEMYVYAIVIEIVLIIIFAFIYDNGKNIISYFRNKWNEVK